MRTGTRNFLAGTTNLWDDFWEMISADNKRIAKNTLMLYCRMAVTMSLGIFTTRVLLEALGVVDYGLVNVIGGIVAMFSFLSGMMSSACSRFYNFEIGRKDFVRLRQTFNLVQLFYVFLVLLLFVLAVTVGVWFLVNRIVVPPDRVEASFWFFQFSTASFLIDIFSIPYSALIISHENMKAFSWISIFESVSRLGIVYLIYISNSDHLVFYGAMLLGISIAHFSLNFLVCQIRYKESRPGFYWEKEHAKELIFFGGWNFFGSIAGLFSNVLVNVLLNNYFGPAVNAARAVASQLSGAISAFTGNFLRATNPQIVQHFASGEIEKSHLLTIRASRVGFLLIFFFTCPAWLLAPFALEIWLHDVPEHAIWFTRLILIQSLIDSFSFPLMTQAQASGRIALYQSVVGGMIWMTLPVCWVLLKFFKTPPEGVICASIAISSINLCLRLILVRRCAKLSIRAFAKNAFIPAISAGTAAAIVPAIICFCVVPESSWTQFFVVGFSFVFCAIPAIALLGFTKFEREILFAFAKQKFLEKWKLSKKS